MTHRQRRRLNFFGIFVCLVIVVILAVMRWRGHPPVAQAASEAARAIAPVKGNPPTNGIQPITLPESAPKIESNPAGASVLANAQAKLEAGDLIGARHMLEDALLAGSLNQTQLTTAKKIISDANQSIVFSPRHYPGDPFATLVTVGPGQTLGKIARDYDITWSFLAKINNLNDPRLLRAGQTLKVIKGPFNAVVTKSTFTMDIWLGTPEKAGSVYVTSYRVGLGEDNSTPTGTWMVQPSGKVRNPTYYSPRGEGIIQADDPKNPVGNYWIGITGVNGQAVGKMSYGIHGTIDPSSIGKMSSLGCIRLGDADIAQVFNLLVEGKSIVIVRK